jgi:proton glutamate symport protein
MAQGELPQVESQNARDVILHIFPENLAKSIAEGQVLQIVVFSILFGIAVAMVNERYRNPILKFSESLSVVMFKFTNIIMMFAPFAVFSAIAYSVGHMGLNVLVNLFTLLATLYVSLLILILGVFFPIIFFLKIPLRKFMKAVAEPATIAFATTSSESALPRAMENMEEFGIPRKIVAFVIPTGYSFNLDGTTLYWRLLSRCKYGRYPSFFDPDCHDADADADQQRGCSCSKGFAGHPAWNSLKFRPANLADFYYSWY